MKIRVFFTLFGARRPVACIFLVLFYLFLMFLFFFACFCVRVADQGRHVEYSQRWLPAPTRSHLPPLLMAKCLQGQTMVYKIKLAADARPRAFLLWLPYLVFCAAMVFIYISSGLACSFFCCKVLSRVQIPFFSFLFLLFPPLL